MIEINKTQYKEFAKQFNKDFADKIFEPANENGDKVTVYADKLHNTNVALITFGWDQFCLAGNAEINDYDDELINFIKSNVLGEGYVTFLNLDLTSPEWEHKIERLLSGYIKCTKLSLGHRLNKESFKKHYKWRDTVPPGYTIAEYDRFSDEFFGKYGKDRPFFDIESEKFGVALIKDDIDEIISECYCVDIDKNNVVGIGIDTYDEQYRRKGFAYLVAAAFIEKCLSKNLEPYWHCHNTDTGSKALADKLGFEVAHSAKCSLVFKEKIEEIIL